jgi:NADP-reducing hydrogenase subunit HndC
VCPAEAISGVVRSPFTIDPSKCIKCGSCMEKCKFGAISKS